MWLLECGHMVTRVGMGGFIVVLGCDYVVALTIWVYLVLLGVLFVTRVWLCCC